MFDPVKGPDNPNRGPSTGDSTENGDSWHLAISKINGMFERLFDAVDGGFERPTEDERIAKLEAEVTELRTRLDAMSQPPVVPPVVVGLTGAAGTAESGNV